MEIITEWENEATYDLALGLDQLVPGADFAGKMPYQTQEEYNSIIWRDERTKPTYEASHEAALVLMRIELSEQINDRTSYEITSGFRYPTAPDTPIHTTMEWQFNVLNLWLIKDSGLLEYPYELYVSQADDSTANYIYVEDSTMLQNIYMLMFQHIAGWLNLGRQQKDSLKGMTRDELEAYKDPR